MTKRDRVRCAWAAGDPLLLAYHDREWGVPSRSERHLFEMLCLEGAQAGLSWLTILRKRDGYRRAFADFDWKVLRRFGPRRVEQLMRDPGIVRNRQKIEAVVANATAFEEVREEFGSFRKYLAAILGEKPRQNQRRSFGEVPAETPESRDLSRELRSRGFRFVGPTTCYAFMQAVGLVNDHLVSCFRHREVRALGR